MKLAIIGSRGFDDYDLLDRTLKDHFGFAPVHLEFQGGYRYQYRFDEIVSGGANGADRLGVRWAKEHGIKFKEFLPDWETFGKRAGFLRNEDIIKACDFCLAFHDGESRGTFNSLEHCRRLKKPTLIVYF